MIEALHLGSMLPAALGACCVAGGADRRSALAWLGMLAMLAAMADTMLLPHPIVPAIVWTAALVALGIAAAVRARLPHGSSDGVTAGARVRPGMGVHRALQSVIMAGLVVIAAGHRAGPAHPAAGHAGHAVPLTALVVAAAVVFASVSAVIVARSGRPALARAEAGLGAASVALMALPLAF
ncbi:hypothetical protein KNO15_00930 [Leifsonia shinshuensis]|uniref:hypothetical protein n=1 Tax=Leifsonia shinshuensis TaxID=150026 RepID=UPI001F508C82|nr:hypothetical protein [Leifsonia shinshuensis]MCI0155265.1 hypothetical protein [Leifsonia shinshuensis]